MKIRTAIDERREGKVLLTDDGRVSINAGSTHHQKIADGSMTRALEKEGRYERRIQLGKERVEPRRKKNSQRRRSVSFAS